MKLKKDRRIFHNLTSGNDFWNISQEKKLKVAELDFTKARSL